MRTARTASARVPPEMDCTSDTGDEWPRTAAAPDWPLSRDERSARTAAATATIRSASCLTSEAFATMSTTASVSESTHRFEQQLAFDVHAIVRAESVDSLSHVAQNGHTQR